MSVERVLIPPLRNLGDGFQVRRALPSVPQRSIGPFVFFDQMGPTRLPPGRGLDVRPHPHIGLATLTYLFDGEIVHRDSLGSEQAIRPYEVNWMIAGGGIVHSERTSRQERERGPSLFGLQCWIGLPRSEEDRSPSFEHHGAQSLPASEENGVSLRLIAGTLAGARAPVRTFSEMVYADIVLAAGARHHVSTEHVERAVYVVQGGVTIDQQQIPAGHMAVLHSGKLANIVADAPARAMLLGGTPLDGPRHLWWNFVSSSVERIEQAKADWLHGRFARVPDDDEFIPLPDTPGP